ncbi:MAG: HEAT repeat domain-containing protein, partial [Verrucomicrobiae bacterium]|nr:HEAT repeat domain-containing protein [Verrucomicrobiae bacterium]
MPPAAAAPKNTRHKTSDAAVDAALGALQTYDWGSSRAALLPLDEAVAAAHGSRATREALERRLLDALRRATSVPAREYLCSQLALIGGKRSVAPLAERLAAPQLATAARHALEAIPDSSAVRALRRALPRLSGREKIGVITSLGVKRDAGSISALTKLLSEAEPQIADAAAWALGEIATPAAARALVRGLARAPAERRAHASAAALTCAERLAAAGHRGEVEALCRWLG